MPMDMEEINETSLYLIGNIPASFHSSDLRAFFSQYVEKGNFTCFHYRHRPEYQSSIQTLAQPTDSATEEEGSTSTTIPKEARTHCCVVAVVSGTGKEFVKNYHNTNWSRSDGEILGQRVRVTKLKVVKEARDEDVSVSHATKESQLRDKDSLSSSGGIPFSDLKSLPELNPPSVMPQGNVGTPLATFMALIRNCKLPSHVIKKLQLEFPKSRTKKRYGAVNLDYGTSVTPGSSDKEDTESKSNAIESNKRKDIESEDSDASDREEEIPPDDDHDAEEWERYEAFHEDVDKQERTTERLFEEELEVVWDKGSSGLVFYTDASYWDQQEGDFDEKCSKEDDWDVDMSAYYHDGGDKDARDFQDMLRERKLREGICIDEGDSTLHQGIGSFEKHTKGIGRRVLKRSGWTEGSGVGASNQGISEPLETEGQHPHVKKGLGYRGEKLNRNVPSAKKRKRTQDVIISTVYDTPAEEENTVSRSAPVTTLKYRTEHIKFLGGGVLKPNDHDLEQQSEQHTDIK